MVKPPPACRWCVHYHVGSGGEARDAFPDGIPDRVLSDVSLHMQPMGGDGGLSFGLSDAMPRDLFEVSYALPHPEQ